jgi:spore protease
MKDITKGKLAKLYARTDLVCEDGGELREYTVRGFRAGESIITEGSGSKRGPGRYVTIFTGALHRCERREDASDAVADELTSMVESALGSKPDEKTTVLVACLGNRSVTADAFGPLAADALVVTRHVSRDNPTVFGMLGCSAVAAIAPGVAAQTGIDSAETIAAAASAIRPDVIITVDALAARSTERLGSTIQLSSAGVEPGSGVGNHRPAINEKLLHAPVIAIGVPTVTDSSSLVLDALSRAGIGEDEISDELRGVLENGRAFVVTPGECDVLVSAAAKIIASAIGSVFGVPCIDA